jgi:hypothetical protein
VSLQVSSIALVPVVAAGAVTVPLGAATCQCVEDLRTTVTLSMAAVLVSAQDCETPRHEQLTRPT